MGSYYEIILWNDIMELYYGIIVMKRIHRMPGTALEPPGGLLSIVLVALKGTRGTFHQQY